MKIATALMYWVIVALWLAVFCTVLVNFLRNPKMYGVTRMLLLVVGIDTCRNIIENVYFGFFFGSQYGLFPSAVAQVLGNPYLLIIPKLINLAAGCVVLGLLLIHWLPKAISERVRSERSVAQLTTLATEDGLTGLINRGHFDVLARAEWSRFERYGRPLSLLMLDVDNFKSINDRYGHDAGDMIIRSVANSFSSAKRDTDIVARIGGDEFAILLPETDEASAAILAERLRDHVSGIVHNFDGEDTQITVSIGVASGTQTMSSCTVLQKRADEALYRAKAAGRNTVKRASGRVTKGTKGKKPLGNNGHFATTGGGR